MFYDDIYFNAEYGKLYELIGEGKLEIFESQSDHGWVQNMFIKREIPLIINGDRYFDITTPYGYGGPIIRSCQNPTAKKTLLRDYYDQFKAYCNQNNIVSEFIRFHPINKNHEDFKEIYQVSFDRKTIGTNLKISDDPIQREFKKNCKRKIKKALELGARYEVIKSPSDLSHFKELYYLTMKRNMADPYYYFPDHYFDAILRELREELVVVNILVDDQVIASELYFAYGKLIHSHLAGSLLEYFDYSPGCLLEYAAALWGIENDYDYIHHGGGRSPAVDDSLLVFKKNFGLNTEFDFYRGQKIWNQLIYDQLCYHHQVDSKSDFFPAYRKVVNGGGRKNDLSKNN